MKKIILFLLSNCLILVLYKIFSSSENPMGPAAGNLQRSCTIVHIKWLAHNFFNIDSSIVKKSKENDLEKNPRYESHYLLMNLTLIMVYQLFLIAKIYFHKYLHRIEKNYTFIRQHLHKLFHITILQDLFKFFTAGPFW